jgi:hypothetical protein
VHTKLGPGEVGVDWMPRRQDRRISESQRQGWSASADWAMEAFALARRDAYGLLPPLGNHGTYTLPAAYAEQAEKDVALQLSRAGVRLAFVLDRGVHYPNNLSTEKAPRRFAEQGPLIEVDLPRR